MENPLIHITIIDRNGEENTYEAPTDMGLNLMEFCKANELRIYSTDA